MVLTRLMDALISIAVARYFSQLRLSDKQDIVLLLQFSYNRVSLLQIV